MKTISFKEENSEDEVRVLGGKEVELPRFMVIFCDHMNYYNKRQLSTFLETAVLHNEDVTSFEVIDTKKSMTYRQGLIIARQFGLVIEFTKSFEDGINGGLKEPDAVKMALVEWDLI